MVIFMGVTMRGIPVLRGGGGRSHMEGTIINRPMSPDTDSLFIRVNKRGEENYFWNYILTICKFLPS